MMNQQVSESVLLSRIQTGAKLLQSLLISSCSFEVARGGCKADAFIEVVWPESPEIFKFVVEIKSRSSAQSISQAISMVRRVVGKDEYPLIMVPYLSPERLTDLEEARVSGIDLCGNGVVVVPGKVYVFCTGYPNRFRDIRPLISPYRGRSAMVARTFLRQPFVRSLTELDSMLREAGIVLSLSQVSKAVSALVDDMILRKTDSTIKLIDAESLIDRLTTSWRKPLIYQRRALRLTAAQDAISCLSNDPSLRWVVAGESSAMRYLAFSQGGPLCIAVSSLYSAVKLLGGEPESVLNFADIELIETDNDGVFFDFEVDEQGRRWSSKIQTLLELSSGDPRQKEAARELRAQILGGIKK